MIRVTFTDDGSACDLDDDTAVQVWGRLWPLSLRNLRGQDDVTVGGRPVTVETFEEQIARLERERDEAHQKYVLRDAWALLWKGWARKLWEEKREAWRILWRLRDAARNACDREMGEGHRYPENVKVSTLVAHLNTMDFGHAEKARAEKAEKRLADLRAWAEERRDVAAQNATAASSGPQAGARFCGENWAFSDVVARIDGKDEESK